MDKKVTYINSVNPPWEYLTFGPWIYLVPQFKPESVLMLGFAGGTVAGLIRMLYGDEPKITGVDIDDCEAVYGSKFIKQDAFDYIKESKKYEVVIVDMWREDQIAPVTFVEDKTFVDHLKRVGDYLIIHATDDTDMSAYKGIHLVRKLKLKTSSFYYYMNRRVARLPVR